MGVLGTKLTSVKLGKAVGALVREQVNYVVLTGQTVFGNGVVAMSSAKLFRTHFVV
jgi:hypothetical protein